MLKLKPVDTFPLTVPVKYPQAGGFIDGKFNVRARFMTQPQFDALRKEFAAGELTQAEQLARIIEPDSWADSLQHEDGRPWTLDEIASDMYLPLQISQAYAEATLDALGKTPRRSR